MSDREQTLNVTGETVEDVDSSSADASLQSFGDFTETIDEGIHENPEVELNTDQDEEVVEDVKVEPEVERIPYGRFKEVNDKFREAEKKAMRLEWELSQARKQEPPAPKKDLSFLQNMDKESILEKINDDSKGFFNELLEAHENTLFEKLGARQREKATNDFYNTFVENNPDFDELWPDIQKVCDRNPAHTPISAYYELTKTRSDGQLQQKITELESKLTKATKEIQNHKLKRTLTPALGAGPSGSTGTVDEINPNLKDTKKVGLTQTLLRNHLQRMQGG